MSNKQFEWTDELVVKAIKEHLLELRANSLRETTKSFVTGFKFRNKPKPIYTTTDGVDLYSEDDEVYFRGGTRLRVGSLHTQSLIGRGLPFFSSLKAVEVYNNLHEKRFSLADVEKALSIEKNPDYRQDIIKRLTNTTK